MLVFCHFYSRIRHFYGIVTKCLAYMSSNYECIVIVRFYFCFDAEYMSWEPEILSPRI